MLTADAHFKPVIPWWLAIEEVGRSLRECYVQWVVQRTSKPPIDAFELATDCIAEWDKFLQRLKSQIL
jgi:hypothetical protein